MNPGEQVYEENQSGDVEARLAKLEREWATAKLNLLEPTLIRPGILQFGSNKMRLNLTGIDATATDSGDALASVPTGIRHRWYKEGFDGDVIAELAGGYSTPGANVFSHAVLRAFVDGFDAGSAKIGAWNETDNHWETLLAVQNIDGSMLSLGDWISSAVTPVFTITRTDDDNYNILLRQGGVLAAFGGSLPVTIIDAQGDLIAGTADNTAARVAFPGLTGYYLKSYTSASTGMAWGSLLDVTNQTGTYSANAGEFVRCSGTFTVTLPTSPASGSVIVVKNSGTGTVTVARGGANTISGGTTGMTSFILGPGDAANFTYYSVGTEWQVW